jgi:hypothetical protein
MAMLTGIEASQHQSGVGNVPALSGKSGNRGNCELKRLVCSVNYDVKGGQSHIVIEKGGVESVSL